jgi:hypothetical protein
MSIPARWASRSALISAARGSRPTPAAARSRAGPRPPAAGEQLTRGLTDLGGGQPDDSMIAAAAFLNSPIS